MADMTPQEQLMLELINRARMDPNGEAARYGINLNEGLAAGTISSTPKQVLAGNDSLALAADRHSNWMLIHNSMVHNETGGTGFSGTTQQDRMTAAGYVFNGPQWWNGENISNIGNSNPATPQMTQFVIDQEKSLFIDTFASDRGHRLNILSEKFQEVGIGQTTGSFTYDNGTFDSSLITQDFAEAGTKVFITGVVYNDTVVNDNFFSVGEQTVGRSVSSTGATTDTTGAGGGYELLYGSGGAKSVTFDLAGGTVTVGLTLGTTNVKVDVVNGNEVWSNTSISSISSNVGELHALGITGVELHAGAGAQHIYGNRANNVLDGGDGADVAVYNGAFANFTITKNGDGSYTVQDKTGAEGTDTVSNIESLQFSDRLYSFAGSAPVLHGGIEDQTAQSGTAFNLSVPTGLFTDPDNDVLTYTAQSANGGALPGWLTFNANTMTFSGTPAKGDAGTVSVKLIANDGTHTTADTFDVVVTVPNTAPVAVDDTGTMKENEIVAFNVLGNDSDPDGDAISISRLVSHSDNADVSIVNGKIQVDYTGANVTAGSTATVDVVYEVTDAGGKTDTAKLTVAVGDDGIVVNTPPVANDDVANLDAGAVTALVDVKANDVDADNDALHVSSIVSHSNNADVMIENGQIRVNYTGATLGAGETAEIDIVYQIADAKGATDTATLTVNLSGLDETRGPDIIGDDTANRLQGTDLGELILGLKGNDKIHANGGDDTLDGGRGADNLWGGSGADTFIFTSRSGHDNVNDFSHAEGDKIDLSDSGISGYRDLIRHHISFDQFEGVLISVNHGNDLWVEDMDGRHMHRSDFIF